MSKRIRLAAALLALVLLALALTGCAAIARKATQTVVEKATGVKVDQNKVTVTGKNGQQATLSSQQGQLPQGLPADFPNYAGTPESSAKQDTPAGTTFSYSIVTPDAIAAVADFYKTKLTSAGWTVENVISGTQGDQVSSILSGKKAAPKMQAQVAVTKTGSQSTKIFIVLVVSKK